MRVTYKLFISDIIQLWPVVSEIENVLYKDNRHIRVWARHVFLDIIMNFINLQEGHLRIISAKYRYNVAIGFRDKDF